MTVTELATYWLHTSSDHAPCLPEPADLVADDWHESGNLE